MRIVFILAAAATVTFVSTPPVSAQQVLVHSCKTDYNRCMKAALTKAQQLCADSLKNTDEYGSSAIVYCDDNNNDAPWAHMKDHCAEARNGCLNDAANRTNPLAHPRLPPDYHPRESDLLDAPHHHKTIRDKAAPGSPERSATSPVTSVKANTTDSNQSKSKSTLGNSTTVSPGVMNSLNPQPLPPGSKTSLNPPPRPPSSMDSINSQPLPPGAVGTQYRR